MIRILSILLIILFIGGGVYFKFFAPTLVNPIQEESSEKFAESLPEKEPVSESRIQKLESEIADLKNQLSNISNKPSTTQVVTQTTPNPVAAKTPPSYIPLGSGGSGNNQDWYTLENYQVVIDPSQYAGYSGMQLEVAFRMDQMAGTAYARLYNLTTNTPISSTVSTTSDQLNWFTSNSFTLPSGSNTYVLQIESPDNTNILLQSARIKVNF